MLMSDANGFAKFVPGFDFLQGLVANAGSALPNMGQWIVPTLDPAELDKRIDELRTVQFWLEQNARMLSATIQALEVQRMTLSTLKGMNVSLGELQAGLQAKASPAPSPAKPPAATSPASDAAGESPASVVDPMQWWGSLTEQFSKLAADAMQGAAAAAAATPTASVASPAAQPAPVRKAPAPRKARSAAPAATGGKPKA